MTRPRARALFDQYTRHGFAFVRWARHPAEIKDALRRVGMRPLLKQCWRNSQLFMVRAYTWIDDLEYREGLVISATVGIPIAHGWLMFRGEPLDLTLDDAVPIIEWSVPFPEVMRRIAAQGYYGPIRADQFNYAWQLLIGTTGLAIEQPREGKEVAA